METKKPEQVRTKEDSEKDTREICIFCGFHTYRYNKDETYKCKHEAR